MATSKNEVKAVFALLCKAMHVKQATSYNDIGDWALDYNPTYGGWNIVKIINKSGAQSQPMGSLRYPSGQFVTMMHFAIRALENRK